MKNIYVHTDLKKRRKVHRTVDLGNGVHVDVNDQYGVVGVEVINIKKLSIEELCTKSLKK